MSEWTLVRGLYAVMGGFAMDSSSASDAFIARLADPRGLDSVWTALSARARTGPATRHLCRGDRRQGQSGQLEETPHLCSGGLILRFLHITLGGVHC